MKTYDRGRFYTTEDIGERRSVTPEGFLVCHDVPIARTGMQLYSSLEVPIEDAGSGEIRVERPETEVFRLETIASFEGKAVTVEHPTEFVTPENWQQLAVGIVQNVRRGEGIQDDLLIADLVITDQAAIAYVNQNLPEVSAGYEASYEQTEPGRGVQRDIVGNHVALVERGRAGPRCSIQDRKPAMKKRNFWDRLMTAVKAKDEEAVKAELEEKKAEDSEDDPEKERENRDEDMSARLDRLEAAVEKLTGKTGDEEDPDKEEEKTGDTVIEAETASSNVQAVGTVLSGDSIKGIAARAEILMPGASFKTTDKAKEQEEVQTFMRDTLTKAYATDGCKDAIDALLIGRDLAVLTGDSLASVFIGAAEIMRVRNNAASTRQSTATKDFGPASVVADINARNRAFWANRNAR